MGNRWRNSPIRHATWPKRGRCGSELCSAQRATLFSSCFFLALTVPFFSTQCAAWWTHTNHSSQASLQRLKFVCHPQITSRHLPLAA
jgi:hypothetical protein